MKLQMGNQKESLCVFITERLGQLLVNLSSPRSQRTSRRLQEDPGRGLLREVTGRLCESTYHPSCLPYSHSSFATCLDSLPTLPPWYMLSVHGDVNQLASHTHFIALHQGYSWSLFPFCRRRY